MRETRGRAPYPTKTCPRCGSELYADMMVCYGCLYDFTRERDASAELPPPTPGLGESAGDGGTGDTEDLSAAARRAASEARTGAYLRTGSVDAARCVSCMRCVSICPHDARRADADALAAIESRLAPLCSVRKEPELFL